MLDTRNHILAVTSALIAEQGFEKTSMNDIMRASGISKGGIYWHFKNKEEIVLAIGESVFTQQMALLDLVMATEGKAINRFDQLIDLIIGSLENAEEGIPSPVEIFAFAMRKPQIMGHLQNYYVRYQSHLADLIQQGVKEGDLDVDDAQQAAMIFMSTIEGILLLAILTNTLGTLSNTLHQAKQIFLKGIKGN